MGERVYSSDDTGKGLPSPEPRTSSFRIIRLTSMISSDRRDDRAENTCSANADRGIRGFRKITDCVIAEPSDAPDLSHLMDDRPVSPIDTHRVFDAETISVRRSLKLSEMDNDELMDVMHSMVRTPLEGSEEYDRFRSDLQSLHAEMERRGIRFRIRSRRRHQDLRRRG